MKGINGIGRTGSVRLGRRGLLLAGVAGVLVIAGCGGPEPDPDGSGYAVTATSQDGSRPPKGSAP